MPPPPVSARTVPPTSAAVMPPPTVSSTAAPRTVPTWIFPAPLEQRSPPPTVPTRISPPPVTSLQSPPMRSAESSPARVSTSSDPSMPPASTAPSEVEPTRWSRRGALKVTVEITGPPGAESTTHWHRGAVKGAHKGGKRADNGGWLRHGHQRQQQEGGECLKICRATYSCP